MQNFLARCAVVAIIGGGFAASGDLSAVVSRGRNLIEAVDVPRGPAAETAPPAGAAAPAPAAKARPTPPMAPNPASPPAATVPPDDGRQAIDHRPPPNGAERIELAGLRAGDRITIWLRTAAFATPLRLVCDVIDPRAGEVLVHGGGTAGPPARAVLQAITGLPTASLIRGDTIRAQRIGSGAGTATDLLASGTIAALASGD
jgi:hypothetical protein